MLQNLNVNDFKALRVELTRFIMAYKFALDEMETKINILKEEFHYIHEYNPIEHVNSRLKSPESIIQKVLRKNLPFELDSVKENIRDIAGLRIICSFISDIYEISKMLQRQKDIKIVCYKDYIENPKPNGYRSLHLIIEIPIFMSDREMVIPVEVQIRTIAMDFWASLEHKIFYKHNKDVPENLIQELKEAATTATELDRKMERLNKEIGSVKEKDVLDGDTFFQDINKNSMEIPLHFLESIVSMKKDSHSEEE